MEYVYNDDVCKEEKVLPNVISILLGNSPFDTEKFYYYFTEIRLN